MDTEPIPELADEDRAIIQAMGDMAEAFQQIVEAIAESLEPITKILIELVERIIEVVKRWQVFGVLFRLRVPGADWLSARWPKRLLPPLVPRMWVWLVS